MMVHDCNSSTSEMEAEDSWEFKVSLSYIVTVRLVKATQEDHNSEKKNPEGREDDRKKRRDKWIDSRKEGSSRLSNVYNSPHIKMNMSILPK